MIYSIYGSYRFARMFAANIGVSYISISETGGTGLNATSISSSAVNLPFSVSLLLGGENSFFEALAGADMVFASASGSISLLGSGVSGTTFVPEFGVGYRYWPHDGGFHFRALLMGLIVPSVTDAVTDTTTGGFVPWAGLSFGYAF